MICLKCWKCPVGWIVNINYYTYYRLPLWILNMCSNKLKNDIKSILIYRRACKNLNNLQKIYGKIPNYGKVDIALSALPNDIQQVLTEHNDKY